VAPSLFAGARPSFVTCANQKSTQWQKSTIKSQPTDRSQQSKVKRMAEVIKRQPNDWRAPVLPSPETESIKSQTNDTTFFFFFIPLIVEW